MSRAFYRIVKQPTPTTEDFRSSMDKCLPPRPPEVADLAVWVGISMFSTIEQAETTQNRYPKLGSYVATVRIPDDGPFVLRQTLKVGHYTVVGCPILLREAVLHVAPAAKSSSE